MMSESSSEESFQPNLERIKERLRQERETFDQHKAHENRWFLLRLVMGYFSVALLLSVIAISSYILLNNKIFSNTVITIAGAALFTDTLGLVISIWKVVFNPNFMTKLAPITQLEESDNKFLDTPTISLASKSDFTILYAKYGVNNSWMDVAPVLRAKIQDGKLQISVTNEQLGGDPAPGVVKKMELTYLYNGRTYSKTISETEMVSLPEP